MGNTVRWYVYNGLGSGLAEVDSSGNVTARRKYDVYDGVRTSAGTSTSKHKFVGSLGHPSDDESGLIYMRARYMDPLTGRFIGEDPAKHGNDWYLYSSNNPVNRVDTDGRIDKAIVDEPELILEFAGMTLAPATRARLLAGGATRLMAVIETFIERLLTGATEDMLASNLANAELEGGEEVLPGVNALEADEVAFKGTSAAYKIDAVSKLYQLVLKLGMSLDDL